MSQQQEHASRYMTNLTKWQDRKMSEALCHILAATFTREEFPLSENDQRAVDAWLDEKFPVRTKKEDRREPPSLFDSLPPAW
jgi:hypothetical protein